MNRDFLLKLYDRLTGLVEKLPGGLQKPILRELVPIRELFLEQRPARLLFLGGPSPEPLAFLEGLLAANLAGQARRKQPPTQDTGGSLSPIEETEPISADCSWQVGPAEAGWRTYGRPQFGTAQVLDARGDFSAPLLRAAVQTHAPDVVVIFFESNSHSSDLSTTIKALEELHDLNQTSPIVALALEPNSLAGVEVLRPALHGRPALSNQPIRVLASGPSDESNRAISEAICAFLPNSSRLEFALLARIRSAQIEIARSLLKSFTAVCGVIGMQPIPLADLPILSSLQSLMVALIAHVSGRQMGPRVLTEFFGAVGVSIGLGMLFREGARALIKIVPIWGHAVSGLVAGAGTYAIGRAAIAYFIEETPAREAKRLWQTLRPKSGSFRKRQLAEASRQIESESKG
jgi:uncharacterized protein (DUF697 family)